MRRSRSAAARAATAAAAAAALLLLAACSGAEGEGNGSAAAVNEAAAAGEDLLPTPEEAEHLADEAAADEAADMNLYGGNAAAGETGNAL